MASILVTYGLPQAGLELLAGHRVVLPAPLTSFTRDQLMALMPQADAVIACGPLEGETIRRGERLKIIANYGAGYDRVDIGAASAIGVPVTNIPDQVTHATAELTLGLMLAVSRRIGEMNLRLRRETPESLFGMGRHMGRCLAGQRLGILGLGRIGGAVAQLGKALGMEVMGYSRRGVDPAVAQPVPFDALLSQSDVLSIHCPLTAETRNLVNGDVLARMKPGAMLINTARGAIVDSEALVDALESGHLAGAGLDVFPEEPHIPARLLALPQCVLTPHAGTNAADTREAMLRACCLQVLDALQGKRPANIVNGL